ncbi:DUF262 domain-containing protein [Aquimarina sp. AD10]|uniref:DUF262 domain-containing protein n=1 Tax=Aquimarina sp. AD10 TaxID=1714849 RepID=UPI000E4C07CE|nr:DUF262 domain-containing protein [Aquimarina sp. AD10]AXT62293.1 DUF262 domain-containing protein [Aquimarina sp. AD10]RKM90512.1 DUF262 domain-containing protein [Aquimarina sp. AD10]
MSSAANKIDANDKTLRDILHSKKYSIDFFQREYKWEKKHIEQLLIDIEEAFSGSYKLGDTIADVSNYDSYYMGPLIFCEKSGVSSIIDGQQRLTSLTLLLIHINNLQKDRDDKEPIDDLIFSRKHGRNSFNIDVPERFNILDAFYKNIDFEINENDNITIHNIYERFQDIKEVFPEYLSGDKLPIFIDWIKEKLIFVEIVAYSDKNAFTIFETMNDRGYNLTPSEMLKGLLLSKVEKENFLIELNDIWRENISKLHYFSRDEDLEFFRAWFRGQYAESMKRSSSAGTAREDFEKIGTSFHRWVKENAKLLKLKSEENYYYFVKSDFVFYSDLYIRIKNMERYPTNGFEIVNYNTNYSVATSLSYPLYLSAISKTDSEEEINDKILIVANFIERYVVLKSILNQPISQTSIRYSFFNTIIKEIRDLSVQELEDNFKTYLTQYDEAYEQIRNISTYNSNRKFLKYFVSRITMYVDNLCDSKTDFYDLITARRKSGSNITHLLKDTDKQKFESDDIFYSVATNIGAIALLRKDIDYIDESETNVLYRILNNGSLSKSENLVLSDKFTLPKINEVGVEWLIKNQSFIIEICEKLWRNSSLKNKIT